MDIEKGLIAALVKEGVARFYEHNLNPAMLTFPYTRVFDFIENHYRTYRKTPDFQTLHSSVGIDFSKEPNEPFAYWAHHATRKFLEGKIYEDLKEVIKDIEEHKVEDCIEKLRTLALNLDKNSASNARPMPFFDIDKVKAYYEKAKAGFTGVPTPYPSLDERTMGWQPEELIVIAARMGVGKCHMKGTEIIMFNGSVKKVEDILVGDLLMGPDSTPRKVTSLSRGREEMFRVTPVKGDSFVVNRSHVLSLKCSGDYLGQYKHGELINITVDDYLKKVKKLQLQLKLWRSGVEFPKKDLPIEPYWVGLWLGDGTLLTTKISNPDVEIHNYLKEYANISGFDCKLYKHKDRCEKISFGYGSAKFFNPVLNLCRVGNEKRIPASYLVNDRDNRLQLLAGLLDSDGFLINGGYEIITKYDGLRDDILFLARSLGLAAYAKKKIGTIKSINFSGEYWRINISGDCSIIPCKVERKKAKDRKQKKNVLVTGFSLESVGEDEYYGFTLDKDRLYLLKDFTVTHNTMALIQFMLTPFNAGKKFLMVSTEMSDVAMTLRGSSFQTGTSYGRLRSGKLTSFEEQYMFKELEKLHHHPNAIIFGGDFKVTVESLALAIIETKPDIVGIDGAYLLKSKQFMAKDRFGRISEAFELIKEVAKQCKVPIVVTTQLNRSKDNKKKSKADMERLAFSDNVGMLADYVFFMSKSEDDENEMIIEPGKMREASDYSDIIVNWDFEKQLFTEKNPPASAATSSWLKQTSVKPDVTTNQTQAKSPVVDYKNKSANDSFIDYSIDDIPI